MTDINAPVTPTSQSLPPSNIAPGTAPVAPPPAPRKKKRWWLRILLTLIILIVALVALAPYLASSGPVRGIVVSQVNKQLDGSIEIADYSIGWTGGITASGIKVYDDRKNLVIDVPKFSTDLSLINAAKQNFELGKTTADIKLAIVTYPDGTTSLDHIAKPAVKPEPAKSVTNEPKTPAKPAEPITLPNVKGDIALNILGGTLSGEGIPQPVTIDPSTITVSIPDINQAIKNSIALKYHVGNAAPGSVTIEGSASAIQNNKLDFAKIADTVKADQTITVGGTDLAVIYPFIAKALGPNSKLSGVANGSLVVKVDGISSIAANGKFEVDKFAFAGASLKDELKDDQILFPFKINTATADGKTKIVIEELGVQSSLASLKVKGQVQQDSLMNLAAKKAPGADGSIVVAVNVPDFGKLSRELPNTAKLAEGVVVNTGSLTTTSTITLSNDRVTLAQTLDLSAEGTKDGKPIKIQPVHLDAGLAALPNGNPIPALKDLKLALTSSFANFTGGGESLAALGLKGNIDLAKLRNEAGQFIEMGQVQMAGTANVDLASTGDPSNATAPITTKLSVNVDNLVASGVGPATTTQPVQLTRLALAANAQLVRDATSAVTGVDGATVTLQTGPADKPLVDVAASASKVDLASQSVGAFELTKLSVNDLSDVQKQFGAFVTALKDQQIKLESGAVYANVAGRYDGKTKTLSLTKPLGLSMPNIVATKAGKPLFGREDITGKIGGVFVLGDTAISAKFSDFAFGSKSGLFTIGKSEDSPFEVMLPKSGGGVKGNGKLNLAADVKRLNDLSQNFTAVTAAVNDATQAAGVVVTKKVGDIRSGMFNGTLTLAHGDQPKTDVTFDGSISNLSVTTNDKPIENETAKVTLSASSPDDLSGVNVAKAGIESRFATANVSDAVVKLGGSDVWNLVQSVKVTAQVPDLPTAYALLQAVAPQSPTPAAPAAERAAFAPAANHPVMLLAMADDEPRKKKSRDKKADGEPKTDDATATPNLEPLAITSGSATLSLDVKRDAGTSKTSINLTDMVVHQLALKRGSQSYAFSKDINMKLNAAVEAAADPKNTAQPILDQIRSITVSQLSGDLGGIATLSMPTALSVKGPLSKPAADGKIQVDGAIESLTPLIAVLQGAAPLPYSGNFSLVQTVSSSTGADGQTVNLDGSMSAPKFSVLDASGKSVFTDAIEMKNNIGAYLDKKSATVRTLNITMPQSKALSVDVTGRVNNWDTNRQIRDFKIGTKGDLAQLWKIIQPMMSREMREQYATLKLQGSLFDLSIDAPSTSFPAKPTIYESMKLLNAKGVITGIEYVDMPQGLTLQQIEIPFDVTKGLLTIQAGKPGARKPTPEDSTDAKANGSALAGLLGGNDKKTNKNAVESDDQTTTTNKRTGKQNKAVAPKTETELKAENGYANAGAINLAGITVDLTNPDLPINVPKNKLLLSNVRLNPVLADSLGKVGAVVLVGSDNPQGLLNLKVAGCRNVPLGDIASRKGNPNATLIVSVDQLQLSGVFPNLLAQACDLGSDGINGHIPDSTITIANGRATTDLTILVDKQMKDEDTGKKSLEGQPIKFAGGLSLASLQLQDFNITIGPELLLREIRKVAPNGATLPLTGLASAPKLDVGKFVSENAIKGLIPGLGGKDKNNAKGDGSSGKSDDPIGDLLGGLGKKKKDKDKDKDK